MEEILDIKSINHGIGKGRLTGKATERAVASIAHIKFHRHSPKKHKTLCVLDFSDMVDIFRMY